MPLREREIDVEYEFGIGAARDEKETDGVAAHRAYMNKVFAVPNPQQLPQLQIEVIKGGQPHYNYIISVE